MLFPIGDLTKDEVRGPRGRLGLRTAAKPDSQDVCFITRADGREAFLGGRMALHPARVVDEDGREVGRTDAVELVTIGQRRGLELAGGGDRRFVVDVDVAAATVTVAPPGRPAPRRGRPRPGRVGRRPRRGSGPGPVLRPRPGRARRGGTGRRGPSRGALDAAPAPGRAGPERGAVPAVRRRRRGTRPGRGWPSDRRVCGHGGPRVRGHRAAAVGALRRGRRRCVGPRRGPAWRRDDPEPSAPTSPSPSPPCRPAAPRAPGPGARPGPPA